MKSLWKIILVVFVAVVMLAATLSAEAGILDKAKKKVKDKAEEKANEEVEEEDTATEAQEEEVTETEAAKGETKPASGGATEDMSLYTKYDFIPGDKVIFYDDMSGEEVGEFPRRWNLVNGVFEVVRLGNEFWIMCTDKGSVRPRVKDAPLPPKYTLEMEIYSNEEDKSGHYFDIFWVDGGGEEIGQFYLRNGTDTYLGVLGQEKASKRLPEKLGKGVHVIRIMATTQSIKCYIDNERVANVPQVEGFQPVGFKITTDPWEEEGNPLLFRGLRFAEGGKTLREQLDETGKIITHGILFDVNSAKIKGESYKTLQEIGQLLSDDATLRLSIEGHTDSDGSDELNMTLSQNRANSVRDYLVSTNKIDSGRLEAKGWGESKPIDTNGSPEGKANNRRVELIKLQ